MKRLAVVLLVGLTVVMPNMAVAWNSVGHLAIAKMAYDQMDEFERAKLFSLLKYHPHYERFLAAGRPDDVSEMEWAIVRSSIWPDYVRMRDPDARGLAVTKYSRPDDHYIDWPLVDPKDTEFFAGKSLIKPDAAEIISALKERCNDLHTRNESYEDKAVAICWIFHLIGDIHQPLHNVTYFSSDKAFLHGDQGGNKFGIKVNGRKWKLHQYWDEIFGEDTQYADDSAEHSVKIYQQAMGVAAGLRSHKLTAADETRMTQNQTFASWSDESFTIAKQVSYRKSDGSGLLQGVEVHSRDSISDDAPEAGPEYEKACRAAAETQAVLAARRLAERIKSLLPKHK